MWDLGLSLLAQLLYGEMYLSRNHVDINLKGLTQRKAIGSTQFLVNVDSLSSITLVCLCLFSINMFNVDVK